MNLFNKINYLKFCFLVCTFTFYLLPFAFTQLDNESAALNKQISEGKTAAGLDAAFNQAKGLYLKDNKYNEFADFLKSLSGKNQLAGPYIDYYIALTRYAQLKYLEEKQSWDEYFNQGNNYRDELTAGAKRVIAATQANDPLNIYARLLLWQFHRDQSDTFQEEALDNLMNALKGYAAGVADAKPIKEAADKLASYGEKVKAKELYRIYAQKIINSKTSDQELVDTAAGFLAGGNTELAEDLYDTYIGRLVKSEPKAKALPLLIEIAKQFAYQDGKVNDPIYAEKVFEKIESLGGKKAFSEELTYLRAFNMERARDFQKAKDYYLELIKRFADYPGLKQVNYKLGIIFTYILGERDSGKAYFGKAGVPGLYQLGLLAQWQEDFAKAKEYYAQVTASQAEARLKEMEEAKPLEYNLKIFLDTSFKPEEPLDINRSSPLSEVYHLDKNQQEEFVSNISMPQAGCSQVELRYFWSGDTGKVKPSSDQSSFTTAYDSAGIKVISLIVASPSGILDRNLDMVEVR